jgi:hypothetical protein
VNGNVIEGNVKGGTDSKWRATRAGKSTHHGKPPPLRISSSP